VSVWKGPVVMAAGIGKADIKSVTVWLTQFFLRVFNFFSVP